MVEKQILEDSEFLQSSGALVKVFETGNTLRMFDAYRRLYDLVKDQIPNERILSAIEYLENQGVLRINGPYLTYQPIK